MARPVPDDSRPV